MWLRCGSPFFFTWEETGEALARHSFQMMLCVSPALPFPLPIIHPPASSLSPGSVLASTVKSHLGKGAGGFREGQDHHLAELHCNPQEERPPPQRYRKGGSVGGVCYLSMGMVVLLMGLVFASVYIYRYFFLVQVRPGGRQAWGSGKGGV